MKKLVALLLAVLMVVALFAGCAPKAEDPADTPADKPADTPADEPADTPAEDPESIEPLKIGVTVIGLNSEYQANLAVGYEKFGEDYGFEVQVADGREDIATQITQVENFIANNMDIIIVHAVDIKAMENVMQQAIDKGISVLCWPTETDVDVTCKYIFDDYDWGYRLGENAAEFINKTFAEDEKVTCVTIASTRSQAIKDRVDAFKAALSEKVGDDRLIWLEDQPALNVQEAMPVVENVLQAHPETRIFGCASDYSAQGVYQVLTQKGLDQSEYWTGGIDALAENINIITKNDNALRCTVGAGILVPQAAHEFATLGAKIHLGLVEKQDYFLTGATVTAETAEAYQTMENEYVIDEELAALFLK